MLLLFLSLLVGCEAITLSPASFIKLNDSETDDIAGNPHFANGAATAAAFDVRSRYLYVIGTVGDVLNVIDLTDPAFPRPIRKISFDDLTEGFPDSIAICNFGSRSYLAVSFEKVGTSTKAFVKIFKPLETPLDDLLIIYDRIVLDGYDPTSMAWSNDCGILVVVQQGRTHKISNAFDDPRPYIDMIVPGLSSVSRTPVSIDGNALAAAGVRHVLRRCEDDATKTSTAIDDLEPRRVTVDDNNVAYISFPKNNAVARLNLTLTGGQSYTLEYMNVGFKDWKPMTIDGADDGLINPQNYPIQTFYQPADLASFTHNGETYLVTADTGEYMSLTGAEEDCQFDESSLGKDWIMNEQFAAGVSAADQAALTAAMSDDSQLGRMRFSKVRNPTDGYDPTTQGFAQVTGYGGRGISILRPATQTRVYDSGDVFESVFSQPDFPEEYRAVFNADVAAASSSPSSRKDMASTTTGSTPRAVTTGMIGDTQVIVVANGNVGGIYAYIVDKSGPDPIPIFQGYSRRGNAGLSWLDSYAMDGDAVGEPETKDIQWIDLNSNSEAMIAVMSNRAGAVSFYRISLAEP
ncbi:uncharacterized protein [Littorina saxatilis]|uniref:Choice-of-anchor I domain-containing protein n=1 Tax=Littorina saxatilis TaxID=31220 RepID=A0AAN9AM07_9CAEN